MMEDAWYDLLLKHTHLTRLCEEVFILLIRSSPDLGSFLGYLDNLAAKPMSNVFYELYITSGISNDWLFF